MAHRLFLLHGMGVNKEDWAKETEVLLKELYASYPRLSTLEFDQRIEVVPIVYDDIFRDELKKWQDGATSLDELLGTVEAGPVKNLTDWLTEAADSDDFAWTHVADVVMYRLFSLVRQRVKTRVAKLLAEGIHSLPPGEPRWSALGHSLGSAVLHDSLDMLMTGQATDLPSGFAPEQAQANLIMMVSNVSRVLQTVPKAYDSVVKPGAAGQAGRGCVHYLNVRHKLDPFVIPKRFDPQNWPDIATVEAGRYRNIDVSHILEGNIHGLTHYLKNPRVHIPLFRRLTFKTAVTIQNEADALNNFEPFDGLTEDQWTSLQEKLEETNIASIGDGWEAFREIAGSFGTVGDWAVDNGLAF